jgi:hypothetical protein
MYQRLATALASNCRAAKLAPATGGGPPASSAEAKPVEWRAFSRSQTATAYVRHCDRILRSIEECTRRQIPFHLALLTETGNLQPTAGVAGPEAEPSVCITAPVPSGDGSKITATTVATPQRELVGASDAALLAIGDTEAIQCQRGDEGLEGDPAHIHLVALGSEPASTPSATRTEEEPQGQAASIPVAVPIVVPFFLRKADPCTSPRATLAASGRECDVRGASSPPPKRALVAQQIAKLPLEKAVLAEVRGCRRCCCCKQPPWP